MRSKTPLSEENRRQLSIFAENIRHLRKTQNLSLEGLSSKIKISVKVLADMENGEDFPAKYLVMLCDFYDVSPSELFSEPFMHDL